MTEACYVDNFMLTVMLLFKFMHKGYHFNLPKISSLIIVKRECNYSSRASNKLDVPRFTPDIRKTQLSIECFHSRDQWACF